MDYEGQNSKKLFETLRNSRKLIQNYTTDFSLDNPQHILVDETFVTPEVSGFLAPWTLKVKTCQVLTTTLRDAE